MNQFAQHLIRTNGLDIQGFQSWAFSPGMLFRTPDKWWGDRGTRTSPHEGIDLRLFRGRGDDIRCLDVGTKIPSPCDGEVVGICADFLGTSIFLIHGPAGDDEALCTIFGHTEPKSGLRVGTTVAEGDVIATIADAGRRSTAVPTHLHISFGRKSEAVPYSTLDWETLSDPAIFTLLDPLDIMGLNYVVLTNQPGTI